MFKTGKNQTKTTEFPNRFFKDQQLEKERRMKERRMKERRMNERRMKERRMKERKEKRERKRKNSFGNEDRTGLSKDFLISLFQEKHICLKLNKRMGRASLKFLNNFF